MAKVKKIGVLTSGGDAPGMNAAVRAVTRTALVRGVSVAGIQKGFSGLVYNEIENFNSMSVANIITHGGTVLYSDRCEIFARDEGMRMAVETCRINGIEGIIIIGGDGSLRGAADLTRLGIKTIGIPASIDRDYTPTDYCIGYDTALNTAIQMVDRLRDTCESHSRCNVVEVMGRDAGYIALETGIAVGAVYTAIKELPFSLEKCIESVDHARLNGKRNIIIVVSEGINSIMKTEDIQKTILEATGVETRYTRLGHVQRGGMPTSRDRVMASVMGNMAAELIISGDSNKVVCYDDGIYKACDLEVCDLIDKFYKRGLENMKPQDKAKMTPEMVEHCEAFIAKRKKQISDLYGVSEIISRNTIVK